jgi:hypothetical protein
MSEELMDDLFDDDDEYCECDECEEEDEYFHSHEQEIEDGKRYPEYLKFFADGVKNLEDFIEFLEHYTGAMKDYQIQGWRMLEPIDGGHFELIHPTIEEN